MGNTNVLFIDSILFQPHEGPGVGVGEGGQGSGFLLIISLGVEIIHLGRGDPLEEGMATHSSILAWEIP